MADLTPADLQSFRVQGFVVIPGVLDARPLAAGHRTATAMLTADPPAAGHRGPYFLWPRFTRTPAHGTGHGLLRFYRESVIGDLAGALLRPDLPPAEPDFAQLATTIPPWPHRLGGPHVDGISPPLADGAPGTFTLLAGAWLTDHTTPNHGNLWVWPGSHLRFGAWLAENGADALGRLQPGRSYAPVELGDPVPLTGPAGSVLLAHYLLGHDIGGHDEPDGTPPRQVIY